MLVEVRAFALIPWIAKNGDTLSTRGGESRQRSLAMGDPGQAQPMRIHVSANGRFPHLQMQFAFPLTRTPPWMTSWHHRRSWVKVVDQGRPNLQAPRPNGPCPQERMSDQTRPELELGRHAPSAFDSACHLPPQTTSTALSFRSRLTLSFTTHIPVVVAHCRSLA